MRFQQESEETILQRVLPLESVFFSKSSGQSNLTWSLLKLLSAAKIFLFCLADTTAVGGRLGLSAEIHLIQTVWTRTRRVPTESGFRDPDCLPRRSDSPICQFAAQNARAVWLGSRWMRRALCHCSQFGAHHPRVWSRGNATCDAHGMSVALAEELSQGWTSSDH